jgi:hypothetical protein
VALASKKRDRRRFPWWPLILILVSAYLFWVLPSQWRDREVEVEFEQPAKQE